MGKQIRILTILGKTGMGKSTLLEGMARDSENIVVFDTMGAYVHESRQKLARIFPGFKVLRTPEDFASYLSPWGEGVRRVLWGAAPYFRVLYIPTVSVSLERQLARVARTLMERYQRTKQASLLFVDEVDVLSKTSAVLEELVKRGRHSLISQAYATRRPYEVGRTLTSQASDIITFQLTEPRDLEYIKGYGIDKAIVGRIPSLPIGSFLHLDIRNGGKERWGNTDSLTLTR